MIKVAFVYILASAITANKNIYAQPVNEDEEHRRFFKKELWYAGGNISLSLFGKTTIIGGTPFISYSAAKWVDVAVSMNVNYISQKNYFINGDKVRQMIYAPGTFVRLYPFPFLYGELCLEHNFVRQKFLPPSGSGYSKEQFNYQVNTMLIGLGYASDRNYDEDEYYFISVSLDALQLEGSPYTNANSNPYPIIRAGYSLRLFPGSKKRRKH